MYSLLSSFLGLAAQKAEHRSYNPSLFIAGRVQMVVVWTLSVQLLHLSGRTSVLLGREQ